jgi:MarR family transcriptional regulator, organic hydroperoxide resistance regulator
LTLRKKIGSRDICLTPAPAHPIRVHTNDMNEPCDHDSEAYLHCCLYFTSITLSRVITEMAEEEFAGTGLSPTYAFLLMLVNGKQGISQKELGTRLHLAPSTVTRFIDKLEAKRLLRRVEQGKNSLIFSTDSGKKLQARIQTCWNNLYERYSGILGEKNGDRLTDMMARASDTLENKA